MCRVASGIRIEQIKSTVGIAEGSVGERLGSGCGATGERLLMRCIKEGRGERGGGEGRGGGEVKLQA